MDDFLRALHGRKTRKWFVAAHDKTANGNLNFTASEVEIEDVTPMKRAAILGLLTWAAFAAVYDLLLRGRIALAPLAALAAGFFMAVIIGTYRVAASKFGDAMRISGRRPPVDGETAGITGGIRTLQPIRSPFTKRDAALYMYHVEHEVPGGSAPIKDYSGLALAPSFVDSQFGSFRVGSFPVLESFETTIDDASQAASYIASTRFEDLRGLKIRETLGAVMEMVAGGHDSVRKDWRLTDEGLTTNSRIVEQVVEPGMSVALIGRYSAADQSIVSAGGVAPRLVRGNADDAAQALRRAGAQNAMVATVIALAVNGAVALPFILTPYRTHGPLVRTKVPSFEEIYRYHDAIRHGALATAQQLVAGGMPPNIAASDGVTPLAIAGNDDVATWLLSNAADVNAVDAKGETVLMSQAELGHAGIVRLLIAHGVKLDELDPKYQMSALEVAEQNEHLEVAQILREAGAADRKVTERNGTRLHDDDPQVRTCVAYLDAIFAGDRKMMVSSWIAAKQKAVADADLEAYRGARPHAAQLVEGFANDTAATLELRGPMEGGTRVTWRYDLVRIDGQWKIRDETWETRFNE